MAETDKPNVPENFDPDKMYRVVLSVAEDNAGHLMVPGASHLVSGDYAETIRAKIAEAVEEAY